MTLSLSHFTPTLPKKIGTLIIWTKSKKSHHPLPPVVGTLKLKIKCLNFERNELYYTNVQQIIVGNSGLGTHPPELFVLIIASL